MAALTAIRPSLLPSASKLDTGAANNDPNSGRFGINSYPPKDLWPNIRDVAFALDEFVERYGAPIRTISVFRGTKYNAGLGGSRNSTHIQFQAVDFSVPSKGNPAEWAKVMQEIRNAGIFRGGIGITSNFVHMDANGVNRNWGGNSETSSN